MAAAGSLGDFATTTSGPRSGRRVRRGGRFPEYTPSPEARYPTAIEQAYAATRWVSEHGGEIGVDGGRLAVAGNSVGGNMAAAVTLMAKERAAARNRLQALLWPVTDAEFRYRFLPGIRRGLFPARDMMQWFWDSYTSDQAQREQSATPRRCAPPGAAQRPAAGAGADRRTATCCATRARPTPAS